MSTPRISLDGLEPRSITDEQRAVAPLARSEDGTWVVLGHAEARRVVEDAEAFSSAVSRFLQVPNGLDGTEHAAVRAATDRFFAPEAMARLEPVLVRIARGLVAELLEDVPGTGTEVDAVAAIGAVFAVRAQTAWLGWPAALEPELLAWMSQNHEATRSGDLAGTAAAAERFDEIIRSVLAPRRALGSEDPGDVTAQLMRVRVALPDPDTPGAVDRLFTEEELVSVLRNWTGGDLGSIALCLGVILRELAHRPVLATRLRTGSAAEATAIIDELLRIDDPFVANRRVARCPVRIGEEEIAAGDRVLVHWTSANRDERVFGRADSVDPAAHASANLVYGAGPHACPGRPLATLELRVLVRELLAAADARPAEEPGEREIAPLGGWAHAPVVLVPRSVTG
ncbi:cytochrome P450 [Brachybacterium hainanense]|uniref:Cytochrome P450 n=1 Tax=Brachybacterium hainanense TaxID=1541174 RepID=A0ABV6R613_9MICO